MNKKQEFTLTFDREDHRFVFEVPRELEKVFKDGDKASCQWALVQILRRNEGEILPLLEAELEKGDDNTIVCCHFFRPTKSSEIIACHGAKGMERQAFIVVDDYPRPVLAGDGLGRVRERSRGFSLIEVVVVVAVMAILATGGYMAVKGAGSAAKAAQATSNARVLNTALETTFANGNATSTAGAVTYTTTGAVPTALTFSIPLPSQVQLEAALSLLGVGNFVEVTSSDTATPAVVWATASATGPSVVFQSGTNAAFQASGAPVGFAFSGNSVVVNSTVPLGGQRSFGIQALAATGASAVPTTAPTTSTSGPTITATTTAPTVTTTAATTTTVPTTPTQITDLPTPTTTVAGGGGLGDGPLPTPSITLPGGGGGPTQPPVTCSGSATSGGCNLSGGGCDSYNSGISCPGASCYIDSSPGSGVGCQDEMGNPITCGTTVDTCTGGTSI